MIEQGFAPLEMGAEEGQAYVERKTIEYRELLKALALSSPQHLNAHVGSSRPTTSAPLPFHPREARLIWDAGVATGRLLTQRASTFNAETVRGKLAVPPGPGLGVEVDEQALKRLTVWQSAVHAPL